MPTVVELKDALRSMGLKLVGDKAELAARLDRARAGRSLDSNRSRAAAAKASVENVVRDMANLKLATRVLNARANRVPAPAPRAHDFSKMTVVQLREHLRRAGKSTTGGRDELERRARGFPDLPPKPARPSPANANAAQRAIFDRVSAKVTAAFDEFERLGPWSSPALTPANLRDKTRRTDIRKFELLRDANWLLAELDIIESDSALAREQNAFLRAASRKHDALVDAAPADLRFHIVA